MVKCSNCETDIPDDSKFCNHCGSRQVNKVEVESEKVYNIEENTNIIKNSETITKNNKFIKIGIITIIAIIFFIILFIIQSSKLTSDEKYAINIVKNYQNMLKDPDSIKLQSDVIVILAEGGDGKYHNYCFFNASGNNSYGASISSTVYFYDEKYFCDMSNTNEFDYENPSEDLTIYVRGALNLSRWKLYGEDAEDFISCATIDAKKVCKKLKIDYN